LRLNNITKTAAEEVDSVIRLLEAAKRPVILIGRGVRSAKAEIELRQFAEKWNVPITYSASAPDIYGTSHEQVIGSVGAMGCSRAGNFAVANSDLLLVLGSRLSSLTTGVDFCKFSRAATTVVVDIDEIEHSKSGIKIDHFLNLDLKIFLTEALKRDGPCVPGTWLEQCVHWKRLFATPEETFKSDTEIDLYDLAKAMGDLLPAPATVVTDSGLIEVIIPSNMSFKDGVTSIHPVSQGAMGFALPAAIGAYVAGSNLVVAIIGDGSIMMNLQELQSIRYHQMPIKVIVVNNNAYSIIRRRQRDLFRNRTIGTDPENGLSCPSFSEVAATFGLKYTRVSDLACLEETLVNMFKDSEAVLCEIIGKQDQGYIEVGHARNSDRKMVRRPLEDQAPFLDRELFLKEMIVDPIDQ